jgi:hypothetical protein
LSITLAGDLGAAAGESISAIWRISSQTEIRRGTSVEFKDLRPGRYTVSVTAVRQLKARVFGRQRHLPDEVPLSLSGLSLATNRTFDPTGKENTEAPNALTTQLFKKGPLSPVDAWTLQFPSEHNPCLRTVTSSDTEQIDISDIADAVLSLEYEMS